MKISFMVPSVTIFDQDGNLDHQGNKNVYDHIINGGIDGIVLMGSTGEFFTMSDAQKRELIKLASEHINGRVRFLVGTSCMDPKETISLSNYALEMGAEAVMIIPPYYFSLTDESVIRYFDQVADGINGNILLYNFPDRTGYDIKPSVTLELARKHKNIVGYKDTVFNMDHTRELIKVVKSEFPDFEILSGYDDNMAHNVLSGGNGCIGGLGNLVPEVASKYADAVRSMDMIAVAENQKIMDQFMTLYSVGSPFIPYVKRGMMLRGIEIGDYCTEPFIRSTPEKDELILSVLKKMGIVE